jgi:pentatricopeptide repeat domain-containing protein 3
MPELVYNEESQVDENALKTLIKDTHIQDAIFVYNLMKKNEIEISNDLRQSFLECLCFYNHEEPLPAEWIEERWFQQGASGSRGKDRQRKTWKDNDLAEQVFSEIEPKDAKAYAAIIRGMAKYFQSERAWALYQEAVEKQLQLDTKTMNSLLQIVSVLKESYELRWQLVQEILTDMNKQQLKPDLGTLNAVLQTLATIGNFKVARNYCTQTLSEFHKLGIEPSLATWFYVLAIFCRERSPVSHVLVDIMNKIEGKEFQISDLKDVNFFVSAMDVCRNHLHDKELAKRVDKLLHTGNNYNLVGDSYKESIYYRHLFGLLCSTEPFDTFMTETYNRLVPNVYIPEPGIMEEILKAVDLNGAIDVLPRLWSDMVMFDHTSRESLLVQVLELMTANQPDAEAVASSTEAADMPDKFGSIAWDVWGKIENEGDYRTQRISWTGAMISDVLTLLCRANNFEKADQVFNKIDKDPHKILGEPKAAAVEDFVRLCITNKQPSRAISSLQFCVESGLGDAKKMARQIVESFTLDEHQTSKIVSLVGPDVLKTIESES